MRAVGGRAGRAGSISGLFPSSRGWQAALNRSTAAIVTRDCFMAFKSARLAGSANISIIGFPIVLTYLHRLQREREPKALGLVEEMMQTVECLLQYQRYRDEHKENQGQPPSLRALKIDARPHVTIARSSGL